MAIKDRIYALMLFCLIFCTESFAQKGLLVDKDSRIDKFEFDLLIYLKKEGQFADTTKMFSLENYKDRMIVNKRLEIYSDSGDRSWLVVRFRPTSDHGDSYWGILNNDEIYMFYNLKDKQFSLFQEKSEPLVVRCVKYFCQNFD